MKFNRQGGLKAGILAVTIGLLAVFFGTAKSEPGISAEPEPTPTSTPATQPTPSTGRLPQPQATPTSRETTPSQPSTQQPHTRTRSS